MAQSHTLLQTDQARRYMSLLGKHWSHHYTVTSTDDGSSIDFGGSSCTFAVKDAGLDITVASPADQLGEMEHVVLEHLQRFAPAGTVLQAVWTRS